MRSSFSSSCKCNHPITGSKYTCMMQAERSEHSNDHLHPADHARSMHISQALFEGCCTECFIKQVSVNAALQFTQLAKQIAELEAAEAQRSAQLQPLIAGSHDSRGWAPLTQPEGNDTFGRCQCSCESQCSRPVCLMQPVTLQWLLNSTCGTLLSRLRQCYCI